MTDINTKCDGYFITKCDRFITQCDSYYKLRRFCYKVQQLLQKTMFITNCDSTLRFINIKKNFIFPRLTCLLMNFTESSSAKWCTSECLIVRRRLFM